MNFMQTVSSVFQRMSLRHTTFLCRSVGTIMVIGLIWFGPTTALAETQHQQIVRVESPVLQGELPYQYMAHYFGVEVQQRDGLIALTLAYEPQNNRNLRGLVNFMVLDEDGMRRFQAGTNPRQLELASGAPLQFDDIGNKMSASFRAVGRGNYTVIVFNNAPLPVRYTLTAEGALLIDAANQSRDLDAPVPEPTVAPIDESAANPSPLGNAGGEQLSGVLDSTIGRHYLQVIPAIQDGNLLFDFRYDPLDQPALHGNVNFWILDQEGLNAIIRGEKAGDVNLATGFPRPFSPFPNELQASFNASGRNPYTAVIFNRTAIPATYEMTVAGGVLEDRYGQTLEAKADGLAQQAQNTGTTESVVSLRSNQKEDAALSETAPATTVDEIRATGNVRIDAEESAQALLGTPQLAGSFKRAYSYHYFALTPSERNGKITLSLTFEPKTVQQVRENINFLVLTEEGLRSVLAGGPPVDYDIATGSFGLFGANQDKLFASFQASGYGPYTVIVYSYASVPARYILTAEGGILATEDVEVGLP